jgi:hypothetical protein
MPDHLRQHAATIFFRPFPCVVPGCGKGGQMVCVAAGNREAALCEAHGRIWDGYPKSDFRGGRERLDMFQDFLARNGHDEDDIPYL